MLSILAPPFISADPVRVRLPVTDTLSSIVVVPPAELRVKLPVAVSIVLSSVTATLISPAYKSAQGSDAEPSPAPSSASGRSVELITTFPLNVEIPVSYTHLTLPTIYSV